MAAPFAARPHAFQHLHAAHCESGVMASMLTHYGLPLSEPMAFGLGAGIAFAVIPFVKLAGQPLIAYRMPPRTIVRGLRSRLGIKMVFRTFRNPEAGMRALDERVDAGHPVGLQTNVFWLPFFPEEMRLHFNAHNLIVYGRRGDEYLISDPVFEAPVSVDRASLQRARFAKGVLAAKGMMYYPTFVPERIDLRRALRSALRSNVRTMTGAPLPMIGIRGIRYLSRRLRKTAQRGTPRDLKLLLGHVVRMQEEIGTGGAGFRFLYASFLQEAAKLVESEVLAEASRRMTEAGDGWRRFALAATRLAKGRGDGGIDEVCKILEECADREAEVWRGLRAFV
jgi:hypothetical protein